MKRPRLLIGVLLGILLLCAGLVYLDQTGMLGNLGSSGSSTSGSSGSSGSGTTDDPYGGLK
ncbi:hypothetical protein [Deinococcus alpinitundrae]|uniref:hypothetical protein n=1 Tax=Deinococcus alpinitundrae TaxID=468913 RepID=UPI0013795EEA|nr:hypothetical protein [Deinococcus alpinitundrae]